MTTRYANVKGISFVDALGQEKAQAALITFDLENVAFTGGSDTVTFGGAGWEDDIAQTLTLAQMVQNRRRNGKTVTLQDVMRGPPGSQAGSTNGPTIYYQGTITISTGNVIGLTLFSAFTSGSAVTTLASHWDRAGAIYVMFTEA